MGRDRSQGHHRSCSSSEHIEQQGPYSATHHLLSLAQTLAATSHLDILSTCLPVSWTNRFLAGLANRPRLLSTREYQGHLNPREPAGDFGIQCLLHSEGHSQPHIPSTSASSLDCPRKCLLLTSTVTSTGRGDGDGGSSHHCLLSLGLEQGNLDELGGTKPPHHHWKSLGSFIQSNREAQSPQAG